MDDEFEAQTAEGLTLDFVQVHAGAPESPWSGMTLRNLYEDNTARIIIVGDCSGDETWWTGVMGSVRLELHVTVSSPEDPAGATTLKMTIEGLGCVAVTDRRAVIVISDEPKGRSGLDDARNGAVRVIEIQRGLLGEFGMKKSFTGQLKFVQLAGEVLLTIVPEMEMNPASVTAPAGSPNKALVEALQRFAAQ